MVQDEVYEFFSYFSLKTKKYMKNIQSAKNILYLLILNTNNQLIYI